VGANWKSLTRCCGKPKSQSRRVTRSPTGTLQTPLALPTLSISSVILKGDRARRPCGAPLAFGAIIERSQQTLSSSACTQVTPPSCSANRSHGLPPLAPEPRNKLTARPLNRGPGSPCHRTNDYSLLNNHFTDESLSHRIRSRSTIIVGSGPSINAV